VPLPTAEILDGIDACADALAPGDAASFTRAIMTTDAFPKRCCVTLDGVTLSAQAKGAGMIEPGYATMLCFVQTDGIVDAPEDRLRAAVSESFERITVDGQMSTNDTVVLQATGAAGRPLPDGLLEATLLQLALEIVADGEGASRVGRIDVTGARDDDEAERVARAIANSPLVKTALYGRDPNWGRIAQAAGMALAGESIGELGPDVIDADGLATADSEAEIALRLDRGDGGSHVFFSDLTHTYIEINAEYTT
jgi:glutamate N-acetyltransferase/amino-acid N-acetyltransferase